MLKIQGLRFTKSYAFLKRPLVDFSWTEKNGRHLQNILFVIYIILYEGEMITCFRALAAG